MQQMFLSAHHPPPPGREHIPQTPRALFFLRIAQIVLALIVLGLTGYGVSISTFSGDTLSLVMAIFTLLGGAYLIVAVMVAPALYSYWAVLALDAFFVFFWLVAFALLAAQVAAGMRLASTYDDYLSSYSAYPDAYGLIYNTTYWAVLGGAAGIGAIEFVLFIATLVLNSVAVHKHRRAHLPCAPVRAGGAFAGGAEKHEMQPPALHPAYAQPVPGPAMQAPTPMYGGGASTTSPITTHGSYSPPQQPVPQPYTQVSPGVAQAPTTHQGVYQNVQ